MHCSRSSVRAARRRGARCVTLTSPQGSRETRTKVKARCCASASVAHKCTRHARLSLASFLPFFFSYPRAYIYPSSSSLLRDAFWSSAIGSSGSLNAECARSSRSLSACSSAYRALALISIWVIVVQCGSIMWLAIYMRDESRKWKSDYGRVQRENAGREQIAFREFKGVWARVRGLRAWSTATVPSSWLNVIVWRLLDSASVNWYFPHCCCRNFIIALCGRCSRCENHIYCIYQSVHLCQVRVLRFIYYYCVI